MSNRTIQIQIDTFDKCATEILERIPNGDEALNPVWQPSWQMYDLLIAQCQRLRKQILDTADADRSHA